MSKLLKTYIKITQDMLAYNDKIISRGACGDCTKCPHVSKNNTTREPCGSVTRASRMGLTSEVTIVQLAAAFKKAYEASLPLVEDIDE